MVNGHTLQWKAPIGGVLAVQIFFVISGFYMFLILDSERVSYRNFIFSRIFRIFPLYYLTLFVSLLCGAFFIRVLQARLDVLWPWRQYFHLFSPLTVFKLVFLNLSIIGQEALGFQDIHLSTGNLAWTLTGQTTEPYLWSFMLVPQAWTLSLELCFYLLAPLLVRRSSPFLASLIVISLAMRVFLQAMGFSQYSSSNMLQDSFANRFLPSALGIFILGGLSYRVYKKYFARGIPRRWVFLASALVFPLLIFDNPLLKSLFHRLPLETFSIFNYALVVTLVAAAAPVFFAATRNNKLDRTIGEYSYSIYIIHYLVQQLAQFALVKGGFDYLHDPAGFKAWYFVLTLGVTLILTVLSTRFLQAKVDAFRHREFRYQLGRRAKKRNSPGNCKAGRSR